eukprot:TRINITY_DN9511_c0_g1_i1.p1 TRINITY_DN9511_c0_g1~~TRINITY_DN9511_c0_g1_i1.p1  ORF type:complete len:997 (+),score=340.67 TRINITY_DN9511_c0_g1_i1:430-2991(+)
MASGVSSVARGIGAAALGPLVAQLLQQLQQAQPLTPLRLGCLVCLRNICEDCARELGTPPAAGQPPIAEALLPQLVQQLDGAADTVQRQPSAEAAKELQLVLEALHLMIDSEGRPAAEMAHLRAQQHVPVLMTALKKASAAAQQIGLSSPVGKNLFAGSLRCYKLLVPHWETLKQSGVLQELLPMIHQVTASPDPDLSLAACEFWLELASNPMALQDLVAQGPVLSQLLQQLLDKMSYGEMELAMLQDEESRTDVKPSRGKRKGREDGDGDDDEDEEVSQWTVRQCAASTVDALATCLGDDLLAPPGQPEGWLLTAQLEPRLKHESYLVVEAAILALGAVIPGCSGAIRPHLPGLTRAFFSLVADTKQHFVVRAMCCWTLSRYTRWIHMQQQLDGTPWLTQYVGLLIKIMTDTSAEGARTVQHRAVSAFGTMLDVCGAELGQMPELLQQIVQSVSPCLLPANHASPANPRGFTTRNLCLLLDCIGHLTRMVGYPMATPEAAQFIFQPLFGQLLPSIPDDNVHVLPRALGCVCLVIQGLGNQSWPYAAGVAQRCLMLLGAVIAKQRAYSTPGSGVVDPPDITNGCWALEIMTRVVEENSDWHLADLEQLVVQTTLPGSSECMCQYALAPLAEPQHKHDKFLLRQGMTFLGTCLERFPSKIMGAIVPHLPTVAANMTQEDELCSDSCWFMGIAVMSSPSLPQDQLRGVMGIAVNALVPCVTDARGWTFPLLKQNAAVAIGRAGLIMPEQMAAHLSQFACSFITHLGLCTEDPKGKEEGFTGLLAMLRVNSAPLQDPDTLRALFGAVNNYRDRGHDLTQRIIALLTHLKAMAGAQWEQIKPLIPADFPADLAQVVA